MTARQRVTLYCLLYCTGNASIQPFLFPSQPTIAWLVIPCTLKARTLSYLAFNFIRLPSTTPSTVCWQSQKQILSSLYHFLSLPISSPAAHVVLLFSTICQLVSHSIKTRIARCRLACLSASLPVCLSVCLSACLLAETCCQK